MGSKTMGVRFTQEERDWIEQYAMFSGKSSSEVIRESVLDAIEDAIDVYEYKMAIEDDDGTRYTIGEAMRELGDA